MKTFPLLAASLLLAARLPLPAADTVELNGITCLPGEKLACLLLYQPARSQPLNFTLSEGESRFGFKLLAVDAAGHRVLIEKCGAKKYVRIGSAPDLVAAAPKPEPAAAPSQPTAADYQAVAGYLASEEVKRIQAGNPLLPNAVAGVIFGAGKNSSGSQSADTVSNNTGQNVNANNSDTGQNVAAVANNVSQNTSSDASSGSQTIGAANNNSVRNFSGGTSAAVPFVFAGTSVGTANSSAASADQNSFAGQLWYQESLNIEQARATTAEDVLAGNTTPFPRTPLTPAGTPDQLVGQEVFFSGNIPGYHVIGYLNE
jgi:hypothetical protein